MKRFFDDNQNTKEQRNKTNDTDDYNADNYENGKRLYYMIYIYVRCLDLINSIIYRNSGGMSEEYDEDDDTDMYHGIDFNDIAPDELAAMEAQAGLQATVITYEAS